MALEIKIDFNDNGNRWIVKLEGEVDIYTSPKLKEMLLDMLEEKKADILLDCEKLEYVDSMGLGALISILKRIRDYEGKIYMENVKPNIRKLFSITELDKVFIIEE